MKSGSLLPVLFVALSAAVQAVETGASGGDGITADELTSIRVACITEGITSEVDDSLFDEFVTTCVEDMIASRKTSGSSG